MDHIIRDVTELGDDQRRAFEQVLGQSLRDDQQIVLGVQNPRQQQPDGPGIDQCTVPDWWKVYEGLSDAEIDDLDAADCQRANLSRAVGES